MRSQPRSATAQGQRSLGLASVAPFLCVIPLPPSSSFAGTRAAIAAGLAHAAALAGERTAQPRLDLGDVLQHQGKGRVLVALFDGVGDQPMRVAHGMLYAGRQIEAGDDL